MKIIAFFSVFVILAGTAAAAEETGRKPPFVLEFTQYTGFLWGGAREYVFKDGSRLSELDWDMKPLYYHAYRFDFARRDKSAGPGFKSSFLIKFGIPADSGKMEDFDWQNENDKSIVTDYSIHDNRTTEAMIMELCAGLSLPVDQRLNFSLYTGFSWMRFMWTGRNGYGLYIDHKTQVNASTPKQQFRGDVITYNQEWWLFYPGVSVELRINRWFMTEVSFQASPAVFCNAADNHLTRNLQFSDCIRWGTYLEYGTEMFFAPNDFFSIGLRGTMRSQHGKAGPSYQSNGSTFERSDSTGAADLDFFEFGAALRLTF